MTFRYTHTAKFFNVNKYHHKFSKTHIKQNNAYNTYRNHNPANQPAFRPHKQIEYE